MRIGESGTTILYSKDNINMTYKIENECVAVSIKYKTTDIPEQVVIFLVGQGFMRVGYNFYKIYLRDNAIKFRKEARKIIPDGLFEMKFRKV